MNDKWSGQIESNTHRMNILTLCERQKKNYIPSVWWHPFGMELDDPKKKKKKPIGTSNKYTWIHWDKNIILSCSVHINSRFRNVFCFCVFLFGNMRFCDHSLIIECMKIDAIPKRSCKKIFFVLSKLNWHAKINI